MARNKRSRFTSTNACGLRTPQATRICASCPRKLGDAANQFRLMLPSTDHRRRDMSCVHHQCSLFRRQVQKVAHRVHVEQRETFRCFRSDGRRIDQVAFQVEIIAQRFPAAGLVEGESPVGCEFSIRACTDRFHSAASRSFCAMCLAICSRTVRSSSGRFFSTRPVRCSSRYMSSTMRRSSPSAILFVTQRTGIVNVDKNDFTVNPTGGGVTFAAANRRSNTCEKPTTA